MVLSPEKDAAPSRRHRARGAASVARAGFTASWPAVGAWGAGLVHAALGAAAVVTPDASAGARILGAALVAYGLAALAWGMLALRAERMPAPRAVVILALCGVVADVALLLMLPARTSIVGVGVGVLLAVAVAVPAAAAARRPRTDTRAASVWGILLAAAVISVVVTPALGAVQDAVLLRDDGTLPVITHDGH